MFNFIATPVFFIVTIAVFLFNRGRCIVVQYYTNVLMPRVRSGDAFLGIIYYNKINIAIYIVFCYYLMFVLPKL